MNLFITFKTGKEIVNVNFKIEVMLKQNNPGNLIKSSTKYFGEVPSKNAYKAFKDMASGYRAIMSLLLHNIHEGNDTIREIIYIYCPPPDGSKLTKGNDTEGYIQFVTSRLDCSANDKIHVTQSYFCALASAISKIENGQEAIQSEVLAGWQLFSTAYSKFIE